MLLRKILKRMVCNYLPTKGIFFIAPFKGMFFNKNSPLRCFKKNTVSTKGMVFKDVEETRQPNIELGMSLFDLPTTNVSIIKIHSRHIKKI